MAYSTLVAGEAAWAGLVRRALFVTTVVGVLALACALPLQGWVLFLWALLALLFALPVLSNARYLVQHDQPTVGILPVAVMGLVPAGLAALLFAQPPIAYGGGALVVVGLLTAVVFAFHLVPMVVLARSAGLPEPGSVVIVCGGAVRDGRPRQTLRDRLDRAVAVERAVEGITFVVSGGPVAGEEVTEADVMYAYLVGQGVDGSRIVCERQAVNTRENVTRSAALAEARALAVPSAVVTSDYHLLRVVEYGREAGLDLVPVAAACPRASAPQQWCREVVTRLYEGEVSRHVPRR